MRVALVLNTRKDESEFEVEYDPPHTIELIKHGIEAAGHEYIFIEADEDLLDNLRKIRPDLVFNRSEGLRGESRESHVPAMLEMLEIPYVGANVLTTAVCLNKGWTKKILVYHGILTPQFHIVSSPEEADKIKFEYPVILKPNEEGSSVGINEDNVVHNLSQLKAKLMDMLSEYIQSILIEQFIAGREFSVGTLGKSDGTLEVLPIVEVDFTNMPPEVGNVLGQRAKTILDDLSHYVCPAKIEDGLKERLETLSLEVCKHLQVPDFARIDFRMDKKERIYFLEINPLPGMDFDPDEQDISFFPLMAMKGGYTYDELIHRLLESAIARYGLKS
ncbi:ATP-grasp domain-containing protein [Candidatus Thorarchaeota archaeon]|nr:MAG: ATP-grasp domain-containing protein [Candidatus Thorarchaeota archaeon]